MNPNLTYSKWTPGDEPPFPTGVIATHRWVELVQAFGILAGFDAWNADLQAGLQTWFTEYVDWLQTSHQGLAAKAMRNNRGIWYEAQVAAFARFVGNDKLAKEVLRSNCPRRLDEQIEPDGSMPHELRRTNSMGYTLMTLRVWAIVALMGDLLDVDLWNCTTDDGRSIRLALDFTGQYIGRPDDWPHQQIKPAPFAGAAFTYLAAAQAYNDDSLREPLARLEPGAVAANAATVLFG